MTIPSYKTHHAAGWRGHVRDDFAPLLGDGDPLEALLRLPHTLRTRHTHWSVYRVQTPAGVIYLRHTTTRPRRTVATLNLQLRMLDAGVAVPMPVLALRGPRGALFAALEVRGPAASVLLREMSRDDPRAPHALQRIAAALAHMHAQGYIHGDPLLGNIILPDDGPPVFLDNDRTRRLPRPFRGHMARRNIVQLLSRVLLRHRPKRLLHFMRSYVQAWDEMGDAQHCPLRKRSRRTAVLRKARQRYRKDLLPHRKEIPSGATKKN